MSSSAAGPSTVLHRFAAPLIGLLGVDPKPRRVREVLGVAIDVWNAVVLDQWDGGGRRHVEVARAKILGEHPELVDAFENLVRRKRDDFGAELWGVTGWDLRADDGGRFTLSVEVRKRSEDAR